MMLTKNTAQSLGLSDRTDAEQSISGGMRYLQDMMSKVPAVDEACRRMKKSGLLRFITWAMRICSMPRADGEAVRNPDSWADVKQRLPLLSQKPWYSKLTYGYAREAYAYVENIRKYQISLGGLFAGKREESDGRDGDSGSLSGGIAT